VGEQAGLSGSPQNGRKPSGRVFGANTKVITDMMDIFTWGEHFLRVGIWKARRARRTEMVVRRHRMMGQEKELEGVLEVEPEASCDVEMTLQR